MENCNFTNCRQLSKKAVALISLFTLGVSGWANSGIAPDGGDSFYVYKKGSTKAVVYALDNLDKMTFGENALSLYMKNGKTDYAYSTLSFISFNGTNAQPTSVGQPMAADGDVNVSYDRGAAVLHIVSRVPLTSVCVYDVQGHQHASLHSGGKTLDVPLAHLKQGVYVVTLTGDGMKKSMKIIK